ncbi:helix-turn-helix domain-containing protein [Polymorphobacter sp. PAMC 29334]|uniref:helix-turn-helix transcriptional regulator n=1 Tax=Polymorphobacter sp. PAMC 29334 TaxID=2862331 RepID=UPI001C672166|nr:helix-turn-helix transcriptional regulator [Polymorphobacter sp. PAMC 29334]QYE36297.1 helix-turn-helix domain-containing protein [Polymorphobacter sp. PAMC 29334]
MRLQTRPMIPSRLPFFFLRDLPMDIGARVLKARMASGLTRRIAAARADISYGTLSRIEVGAQRPSPATLLAIAGTWGGDLEDLAPVWDEVQVEIENSGLWSAGPSIRTIRIQRGLTLEALAEAAGMVPSTLSRFERGMHVPRGIAVVGDPDHGADDKHDLVVTSAALAKALGYQSAAALMVACRKLLEEQVTDS